MLKIKYDNRYNSVSLKYMSYQLFVDFADWFNEKSGASQTPEQSP